MNLSRLAIPNGQYTIKQTVPFASVQTAGLTNTVTLATPAGNQEIIGVTMGLPSTAFAGVGIATLTAVPQIDLVPITGFSTNMLNTTDALATGTRGRAVVSITNLYGTAHTLGVLFTAVGANLSLLTQGSIDFYIDYALLPS